MARDTKRRIIIGMYALLLFGFGFLTYDALKPDPTCSDGKRNQNEEEIDCGGVCGACKKTAPAEDLRVESVDLVYGGANRYDVGAGVYNPNDRYGASEFSYTFVVKDAQGGVIAERKGRSFILPREKKQLIEVGLDAPVAGEHVGIKIDDIQWQTFEGYQEQPAIRVSSKRFDYVSSGSGFGEAYGVVENNSKFDFQSLLVKVILRDPSGKPVAVNTTEMRTVPSGERRDFRLVWPSSFPGEVVSVDTEVEADVYRSENFIRQYIPSSPVQGF
jgi:hypothetical protein